MKLKVNCFSFYYNFQFQFYVVVIFLYTCICSSLHDIIITKHFKNKLNTLIHVTRWTVVRLSLGYNCLFKTKIFNSTFKISFVKYLAVCQPEMIFAVADPGI